MLPDPALLFSVHLAVTGAMAGVLWAVQLAVYPLFGAVGRADFPAYHRRYATRIGWVVGPLMLAEAATAAALWLGGLRAAGFSASLALLAIAWVSTAFVQVPLHRRLAAGYAAGAHRWLVRSNWLRTAAWSARAALVLLVRP